MSKTYRQSSVATPEQFAEDPENRLLARGSRFRMDAEMIRDQILATSGLLSPTMYGKSVKPPQPDGLWKAVTMIGERYKPTPARTIYRRSVYTYLEARDAAAADDDPERADTATPASRAASAPTRRRRRCCC